MALDGGRGGHLGADEVRAPAAALAALEVAVRGRGAALAGLEDVGVHAQAHRAAGGPPVEAGGAEHAVEPDVGDRRAWLERHVAQGALLTVGAWLGHLPGYPDDLGRRRAPGDER